MNMSENPKIPMSSGSLKLLLVGLLVMVAGYILMMGGGVKDPEVFNWSMFDFRRLVAAPVVIVCGIVIEVVAIMKRPSSPEEKQEKGEGK